MGSMRAQQEESKAHTPSSSSKQCTAPAVVSSCEVATCNGPPPGGCTKSPAEEFPPTPGRESSGGYTCLKSDEVRLRGPSGRLEAKKVHPNTNRSDKMRLCMVDKINWFPWKKNINRNSKQVFKSTIHQINIDR